MATPDPRTIARALDVVQRLPTEALADLAERLIDRLDAAEPDPDLEPGEDAEPDDDDCCEAGDDDPASSRPCHGVFGISEAGDPYDAERSAAVPFEFSELMPPPCCGPVRVRKSGE